MKNTDKPSNWGSRSDMDSLIEFALSPEGKKAFKKSVEDNRLNILWEKLATFWELSEEEKSIILDCPDPQSRIVDLLKIDSALRCLIPSKPQEWIRKPNKQFDGTTALDIMLQGYAVRIRDYLEAELNSGH